MMGYIDAFAEPETIDRLLGFSRKMVILVEMKPWSHSGLHYVLIKLLFMFIRLDFAFLFLLILFFCLFI